MRKMRVWLGSVAVSLTTMMLTSPALADIESQKRGYEQIGEGVGIMIIAVVIGGIGYWISKKNKK